MSASQGEKLIGISVGPVQEFIASARKLRDLWYGSWLLSELAKAVAACLATNGCRLIFPAATEADALRRGSALNVANKILALAPAGTDPGDLLHKAKDAFGARWRQTCLDARAELPTNAIKDALFNAQVVDFGEVFGAWVSMEEGYAAARARLEKLLAGRKSLREFQVPAWDGKGLPKSSLDGMRESVIRNPASLGRRNALKKGEQLDTLAVVKRLGPLSERHRPHFESLSEVAVLPYLQGLVVTGEQTEVSASLERLRADFDAALANTGFDPELLPSVHDEGMPWLHPKFPGEFLLYSRFKEWLDDNDLGEELAWIKVGGALRTLHRKTREPIPYACLLVGDGDHMGKTLDAMQDVKHHRAFSAGLDEFARSVGAVVEKHRGRLIYSGGDDVMAYLPLHSALACAAEITNFFDSVMSRICAGCGGQAPTFSAGLVIVHHLKPLYQAIELARKAEKHAKTCGRNGLAVIQSKRSGGDTSVFGHWGERNGLGGIAERLLSMTGLYRLGRLSSRLGYQLRQVAASCPGPMAWTENTAGELQPGNVPAAEALRVVGRKRQKDGEFLQTNDRRALLRGRTDLNSLADELIIAYQIAASMDIAGGIWTSGEDE